MADARGEQHEAEAARPPHRPLLTYYGRPEARASFVRDLFNRTAGSYDGINRVLSLGSGRWYRRQTLLHAGLRPGTRLLDLAVGTGLLAREAVHILGRAEDVTGLDVSEGMLAETRRALPIRLVQGRAEALPFADESFDMVTMGYALRHVSSLALLFAEINRVLRPGAGLMLLELGRPQSRLGYLVAKAYLGRLIPWLSRLAGADARTLMLYFWDTIDACVPFTEVMRELEAGGFKDVRCETQMGLLRAYLARKPA